MKNFFSLSYSDHEAICVTLGTTATSNKKVYEADCTAQLEIISQAQEILKKATLRIFWKQCWMVAISLTFL